MDIFQKNTLAIFISTIGTSMFGKKIAYYARERQLRLLRSGKKRLRLGWLANIAQKWCYFLIDNIEFEKWRDQIIIDGVPSQH